MDKYTREQEVAGDQWYNEGRLVLLVLTVILSLSTFLD